MSSLIISVFENKIFLEILKELKLFPGSKIDFYEDVNLYKKDNLNSDQLLIFFMTNKNKNNFIKFKQKDLPIIVISDPKVYQRFPENDFIEQIKLPFKIIDLKNKATSLLAKYKFKSDSLISLRDYIIDKNARKIKKNDIELELTEKEIEFLILFSKSNQPLSKNFVLEKIWKYSSETDTHTVETHIHRLRKKILEKFKDNNFIKSGSEGYYI